MRDSFGCAGASTRRVGGFASFGLTVSALFAGSEAFAALPVKLAFTTAARTVAANACSAVVTVKTQDRNSVLSPVTKATTVSLSGTSFQFYSDSTCATRVTTRTIAAGTNNAKFYFKSTVAGSRAVTVTATGLTSASQNEHVNPAVAAALVFSTQPVSQTAGVALSPVRVSVNDAYGNRVTTSIATVTLSLAANPGGATLSGPTSAAASSGQATFSGLSLNKAGTGYKLKASSTGLTAATSSAFNIAAAPAPSPSPSPTPTSGAMRPMPSWLWGVTVDNIIPINDVVTSLKNLSRMPITRIVFDEFMAASYYKSAVTQVRGVSYVMGELLDSYYMPQYTLDQYKARTTEYLDSMGELVDLWEIGNETNGEWLGPTADVVAKVSAAYDLVKARGKRAALTLYYNEDCWAKPANEMFTWTQTNIPSRIKQGVDYVLVSYYEDDCNGLKPDWQAVFTKVAQIFPNAKLAIGEMGTTDPARKAEMINRYYNMELAVPSFVGGNFYWYYVQDMVPWTKSLWSTLNMAFQ